MKEVETCSRLSSRFCAYSGPQQHFKEEALFAHPCANCCWLSFLCRVPSDFCAWPPQMPCVAMGLAGGNRVFLLIMLCSPTTSSIVGRGGRAFVLLLRRLLRFPDSSPPLPCGRVGDRGRNTFLGCTIVKIYGYERSIIWTGAGARCKRSRTDQLVFFFGLSLQLGGVIRACAQYNTGGTSVSMGCCTSVGRVQLGHHHIFLFSCSSAQYSWEGSSFMSCVWCGLCVGVDGIMSHGALPASRFNRGPAGINHVQHLVCNSQKALASHVYISGSCQIVSSLVLS